MLLYPLKLLKEEIVLYVVKGRIANSVIRLFCLPASILEELLQQNSSLCCDSDSTECTDCNLIQNLNSEIELSLSVIPESLWN